ncbi:MAG: lysoplasmalogenase [Planctomycetaceae bacterium]|jgi:uncharacterized membrane protein YhhN|nr:lysoplasmalogenase [Planctomycetaceae bacterium]
MPNIVSIFNNCFLLPVICIVILLFFSDKGIKKDRWFIILAFLFSIVGDWFLSHRHGLSSRFVSGIVWFFFAHLSYLIFCLKNGRIPKRFLQIILIAYTLFFFIFLRQGISEPILLIAVFVYTVVSCFSLATSFGLTLSFASHWFFFAGITSLVFSDTIIACREFLDFNQYAFLIRPTYHFSQILITVALLFKTQNEQPPHKRLKY